MGRENRPKIENTTTLESVLKQDRAVVLAGVIGVAVLAGSYMVYLALSANDMGAGMAMARLQSWTAAGFSLMWTVTVVAMMVLTAAPMLLP